MPLHCRLPYTQAMYASVHDAAFVVAIAVQNLVINSNEGVRTIRTHFRKKTCPLHSAGTRHRGLGRKLLQQIRMVNLLNDRRRFLFVHTLRIWWFIKTIFLD